MNNDREGQVVTFYSFKGGVGRSMGLALTSCTVPAAGDASLRWERRKRRELERTGPAAPGTREYEATAWRAAGRITSTTGTG